MARCIGNLFLNKGFISGLILLGQGDKEYFFRKTKFRLFTRTCFLTKNIAPPRFLATIANLPNSAWVHNKLFYLAQ